MLVGGGCVSTSPMFLVVGSIFLEYNVIETTDNRFVVNFVGKEE